MQEYSGYVHKTLRQILLFSAAAAAGLLLLGKTKYITGFLFGALASMLYFMLLVYRIRKSADLPIVKAVNYMRGGWLIRLSFIALIFPLVNKLSQVNFLAVIAGLFTFQMVLIINSFIIVVKAAVINKK